MTELLVNTRVGELTEPEAASSAQRTSLLPFPSARRGWIVRRMLLGADVVGLFGAFALQALVDHGASYLATGAFGWNIAALIVASPLLVVAAKVYGLYDGDDERADHLALDEVVALFHLLTVAVWGTAAVVVVVGYSTVDVHWVVFWMLALGSISSTRVLVRTVRLRRDTLSQPTLIIGTDKVAAVIGQKLLRHREYGQHLLGFVRLFDDAPNRIPKFMPPVLGDLEDVPRLVRDRSVERVIVMLGSEDHDEAVEDVIRVIQDLDVRIDVAPRLLGVVGPYVRLHTVEGVPLVSLPPLRLSRSSLLLKRTMDLAIAFVLTAALAPLLLLIAVAIKLTSRGPVIFRQQRIGGDERLFEIRKFRTMVADAERRKPEVAHLNRHLGPGGDPRMFKVSGDPRTTRVGSFLRRWSLDELPQLINVIRGEMSLVGPRPLIPDEHRHVDRWARRRLELKPGLTGLWQVLGRSEIPFEEMVKLDYLYVTGWSLREDLKLMAQTVPALLRAQGSY